MGAPGALLVGLGEPPRRPGAAPHVRDRLPHPVRLHRRLHLCRLRALAAAARPVDERARPGLPGVPAVDGDDAAGRERQPPRRAGRCPARQPGAGPRRAGLDAVAEPGRDHRRAWRWSASGPFSPRPSPPAMSAASQPATRLPPAASIFRPIIAAGSPARRVIGQLFDRFGWPVADRRNIRGARAGGRARASPRRTGAGTMSERYRRGVDIVQAVVRRPGRAIPDQPGRRSRARFRADGDRVSVWRYLCA